MPKPEPTKPKRTAATKPVKDSLYVTLPIDDLRDDPANENLHSEAQLKVLEASYREYGQQKPILIDRKKTVIAGHGLRAAMRRAGAQTIECKYSDLTGAKRDSYRILDNKSGRLSEFDWQLLRQSVQGLKAKLGDKFDPLALGFNADELTPLLAAEWKRPALDHEMIPDMTGTTTADMTGKLTVVFDVEQRAIVEAAVENLRVETGDEGLNIASGLTALCHASFPSNKRRRR